MDNSVDPLLLASIAALEEILGPEPTPTLTTTTQASVGNLPDMAVRRRRASAYLATMPPGIQGSNGSGATYAAVCAAVHGFALGADEGLRLILEEYNPRCDPPWSEGELAHKVNDAAAKSHREPAGYLLARGGVDPAILEAAELLMRPSASPSPSVASSPPAPVPPVGQQANANKLRPDPKDAIHTHDDDPHRLARAFLTRYAHPERATLAYWKEEFYKWSGSFWQRCSVASVKPEVTQCLIRYFEALQGQYTKLLEQGSIDEMPRRCKVTVPLVSNVVNALTGETYVPDFDKVPAWLAGENRPDVLDLVPTANGVVHLPRYVAGDADAITPPTPMFFNTNAVEFAVTPKAPQPVRWLQFLADVWPDDPEAISLLQEWFGYLLTPNTKQQKMLLMVGPRRSGKGTITRVLKALVGEANCCSPTMQSLTGPFGLSPLLGKSVAIMDDVRLSGKTDRGIVASTLLSISGEADSTVERKHLPAVDTKLHVRFVATANEFPRLEDSSGALASRWCVLEFTRSFEGKENPNLIDELLKELPGIFNWAAEGWARLRRSKRFTVPASAAEMVEQMHESGSPVGAFVRERCQVGVAYTTPSDDLYREWRSWCEETGRKEPGNRDEFFRLFKAAVPGARRKQRRTEDGRVWYYTGIRVGVSTNEIDFVPGTVSPPVTTVTTEFLLHAKQNKETDVLGVQLENSGDSGDAVTGDVIPPGEVLEL